MDLLWEEDKNMRGKGGKGVKKELTCLIICIHFPC